MKYGIENSNYRHGGYCGDGYRADIRAGLAKDLLLRIMTTRGDSRGRIPFTNEELHWSARVVHDRPDWARDTLNGLGFNDAYYGERAGND